MTPAATTPTCLLAVSACLAPSPAPTEYAIDRIEDRVIVSGRSGEATLLDFQLRLDGELVHADYEDADGRRVALTIEVRARSIVRPDAFVDDGSAVLELSGPIVAGEARWLARLGDRVFDPDIDAERAALAAELGATAIGGAFLAVLPFRDKVRARMAETRTVFELAALALPTRDPAALPPTYVDDGDRPDQMLPGDTPALGMTCSASIPCPGVAPFCVTLDHDAERGVCLRTCIDDLDCDVPAGRGACGVEVADVPQVTGTLPMCSLTCLDASCPYLLGCTAGECLAM
jgi:hypothetical protein